MIETKVFIDKLPSETGIYCCNCKHFWQWGVVSGDCKLQNKGKTAHQKCKKFEYGERKEII
jgi:hypothetical protein